jgi:tRNA/rRNA methyltransferase
VLELALTCRTTFVLVRPHYPENVGAVARAIKTMGITRLSLVRPGRLAVPEHEMAQKMAVKALDVLDEAKRYESLDDALAAMTLVFSTTSRRGVSGVVSPRRAAEIAQAHVDEEDGAVAFVFGNEKTGLEGAEIARARFCVRIPMAADQPSVNLAQAAQVIAYELFVTALDRRERGL